MADGRAERPALERRTGPTPIAKRWRRILLTVFLALALGLPVGAMIQPLPASATEAPEAPLVPQARQGDAGRYGHVAVRITDDGPRALGPEAFHLEFAWLPADAWQGAPVGNGQPVLQVHGPSAQGTLLQAGGPRTLDFTVMHQYRYDSLTGQLLAHVNSTVTDENHPGRAAGGRDTDLKTTTFTVPSVPHEAGTDAGSPGLDATRTSRPPLCGLAFQPQAPGAPDAGVCEWADALRDLGDDAPWTRDRLGDYLAVAYASAGQGEPDHFVWWSPEFPVPLRLAFERSNDPGVWDLYRLTHFVAGTDAYPARASAGLPEHVQGWTPLRAWGLEDDGVDHPFPLSQAFERARTDPLQPGLRTFLAEHPAAQIESATSLVRRIDGRAVREEFEWRFVVADASTRYGVAVIAHRVDDDVTTPWSYRYGPESFRTLPPDPSRPPLAPDAAQALPTVAGLFAISDALVQTAPFPVWGFDLRCADGACADAFPFWAGRAGDLARRDPADEEVLATGFTESGDPEAVQESLTEKVEFDASGQARRVTTHWTTWGTSGDAPVDDDARIQSDANAPVPQVINTGAWDIPWQAYVVGVGATALIVAAAQALLLGLQALAARVGAHLPFFTRLTQPDTLRHPVRAQILGLVRTAPGLHYQELARRLGLAQGSLQHHLDMLVRHDVLSKANANGRTCYFVRGEVDRRVAQVLTFLKTPGAIQVLSAIAERPGLNGRAVAAATGLDPGTVTYHVKRLAGVAALTTLRAGRSIQLQPTAEGVQALRMAAVAGTQAPFEAGPAQGAGAPADGS